MDRSSADEDLVLTPSSKGRDTEGEFHLLIKPQSVPNMLLDIGGTVKFASYLSNNT